MAARSKARKRALDILFASELRSEDPVVALDRAIEAGEGPTNDYTATLVRGVVEPVAVVDLLGGVGGGVHDADSRPPGTARDAPFG